MVTFSPPKNTITGPGRNRIPPSSETEPPPVVSISDIHGYLTEARSALLTLRDHDTHSPVVLADDDGQLHWAGENYVLVFNGDLIDRGPANDEVLQMVGRLLQEAPPGRVRLTLGNHEHLLMCPEEFSRFDWYSVQTSSDERRQFLERIRAGHVIAAYRGHNVTYAHAGCPDPYDPETVNGTLLTAAETLADAAGTDEDAAVQREVTATHDRVLGVGNGYMKGPTAGLVWLDFSYLPEDAPPQVVGHSRHETPTQKGDVYCQNVLRENQGSPGGEAIFLETPDELSCLTRTDGGDVATTRLAQFE